jgi:mRNA interferase RelE/StbE
VAYRIEFRPAALRQFVALSPKVQRSLQTVIDSLTHNPRPPGVKKLHSEESLYRIKAGPAKSYRIVYHVRDALLLILVVKIGDRKDVHRNLRITDPKLPSRARTRSLRFSGSWATPAIRIESIDAAPRRQRAVLTTTKGESISIRAKPPVVPASGRY